jgi:hypothetical protein
MHGKMYRKVLLVCLLALAGSASVFFAGRGPMRPASPPNTVPIRPHLQAQDRPARIASALEGDLKIRRGNSAKANKSPANKLISPGLSHVSIPMSFEPNVGQLDAPVEYMGRGRRLTVFLTRQEIAVRVAQSLDANGAANGTLILRVAANADFAWAGREILAGQSNYFVGNDPGNWRTRVPHFARVESPSSPDGVGMVIYGNDNGLEYDLRLAPGVDVSKLRLTLTGARRVRLDAAGDLLLNVGNDEVTMKKPTVYEVAHHGWHSSGSRRHGALGARRARKYSPRKSQRTPGAKGRTSGAKRRRAANPCAPKLPRAGQTTTSPRDTPCPGRSPKHAGSRAQSVRRRIAGDYVIEADGSIGFRIGPHDPDATLIVDPSLSVAYGTFLGGLGADTAASVALDSTGKIYVGGTTTSTTFPGSPASKLGPADGPSQFFIAKIDPAKTGASSLIYLTFFGGSGTQSGGLIAVDAAGNVAITGTTTATDFPVTDTSHPTSALASGNGNDVTVSEVGPAGNTLVFSTLFGGSGTQSQSGPGGIALDPAGDVYVASDVQTTLVDSASPDLPVTAGAFRTTWDGESGDAFLAVFEPPATAGGAATLKYCSYLGTNSNGEPGVGGIAVDSIGSAYIAGFTSNGVNGFPVKNAVQTAYGGGSSDAFLMKLSPSGKGDADLVYATLLGGSGQDEALGVALDSANPPNAYITGTTGSPNLPTNGVVGAFQAGLHANATANAFLSVVSENGITGQTSLAYSSYLGGSHMDSGQGIAVSAPNAVYITGVTTSPDLPWHDNLQAFNGVGDAFVAKWDPTSPGAASLLYLSPLGGTSPAGAAASATGKAIAADKSGHVYVAGASTSADFPTAVTTQSALNGFQPSCASCQLSPPSSDAFVAEIAESATSLPSVYFNVGRVNFLPVAVGTSSVPQPVALFNGGEANLAISGIAVAGVNAADFSVIGGAACIGPAIGSTSMCSFEVGFTPSTSSPEVATVTVSDNAPGSPQVLELVAAGEPSVATISPTALDFGNQPENSTSPAQTITLTNSGSQSLTVANIVEGGPDAAQFGIVAGGGAPGSAVCQAGFALAPQSSCVIRFAFDPNAARAFNAEVDFFYNSQQASNTEQIVKLTGVGTATAPIASLAPPSLVFGNQNVGSRSVAQTVSLMNQGSATLDISGIALSGTNASDFVIATVGTTCPVAGGTVIVQATCTLAVQLAPQSAGTKNASLSFTDNAAGSPQQIALSGTATAPPSLQVSPSSLTFAAQSDGISSTPQNITISNSGGAAAGISGIAISGTNAGDFSSPATCTPNPVPPAGSCQIGVTFAPAATALGIRTATLGVPGGNPATVSLSGTATQSAISVPTGVNFGSQLAGGAGGSPQPIVVTNSSSGPFAGALTIASVARTGSNSGDFALASDSCTGASTPPGETCTIQLAFKPMQSAACGANGGVRSAALSLNDNAPGSPHSIPLSGTATDFCINIATGQPVVAPIKAGQSATYMLAIDSSAGFTGSAALSCAVPAALLGSCSITTTPATNPPVVQISPTSAGTLQVVVTTTPQPAVAQWVVQRQPRIPSLPGSGQLRSIVALLLAVLAAWLLRKRKPILAKLAQMGALILLCSVAMAACGGGGSAKPADPQPGTPCGTYTITLTATVSPAGQPSVSRTFPLSLTVQNTDPSVACSTP